MLPRLDLILVILLFLPNTILAQSAPPANGSTPCAAPITTADNAATVREVMNRVNAYVRLHRELEGALPTREVSRDPAAIREAVAALGAKLQAKRRGVQQGNIFFPAAAALYRRLVTECLDKEAISARDVAIVAWEESERGDFQAVVNGSLPGAPLSMMFPQILCALPELPVELQYRIVGYDLVLWDEHANLIVDIVPEIIPVILMTAR